MKSNAQEATPPEESTFKELEVYIGVYPQMAINKYTFKAYISQNGKAQQVYSQNPQDDPPTESDFKQLPKAFPVIMKWETKQYLNIEVLERKSKKLFGKVGNLTVGELFGSRQEGVKKPLKSGEHILGNIFVHFQDKQKENEMVKLQIITEEVQIGGCLCFWQDSYYFTITRKLINNDHLVYKSSSTKSPSEAFPPIEISTRKLCANKPNHDLTINFHNTSDHKIIGKSTFSLTVLDRGNNDFFKIENNKKVSKGRLIAKYEKKGIKHEFTEYFKNGMQMALVVGIDFTMSNLSFNDTNSLHYFKGPIKSLYEIALTEVCGILLQFDYDKKVPVYGFGAKVEYKEIHSGINTYHCFPISGLQKQHDLVGLQGISNAYRACLPHLTFSGPTRFSPIIGQAMRVCQDMKKQGREYMILLLLTDGDINDNQQTIELIVACSRLPISIIIVGITNDNDEEWPLMKKLDDNDLQLKDGTGKKSERDLVKFVQFKKFYQNEGKLAKQVLSELPRQVQEYHSLENIIPSDYNRHILKDDRLIAQRQDQAKEKEKFDSYCMNIGSQKRLNEFKQEKEKEDIDASMINISLDNMMVSRPRSPKAGKKYTPQD